MEKTNVKLPQEIVEALTKIQSSSIIEYDNGTLQQIYEGFIWEVEKTTSSERQRLMAQIIKAQFAGEDTSELEKELQAHPQEAVFCFRLETPISQLQGTKITNNNGKKFYSVMTNVQEIYIHQNALEAGLVEFEKVRKVRRTNGGAETPLFKIKLSKAILEVTEDVVDRFDKVIRPKRAMVSGISYRSMQVVSSLVYNMQKQEQRASRLMSEEDILNMSK